MKTRSILQQLLASGLLVTVLLVLTYLMGVAYYAGYLRGWGLPFEFMPLSRDGVLMQGAYAVMSLGAAVMVPILVAALLMVPAMLMVTSTRQWVVRSLGRSRRAASLVPALRGAKLPNQTVRGEPDTSMRVLLFSIEAGWIVLMGFSAFFVLMWTLNRATAVGEAQARQDAVCSGCASYALTFKDDAPMSGRLVRCTDSHCIVQSEGNVFVVRLEDIERIQPLVFSTQ